LVTNFSCWLRRVTSCIHCSSWWYNGRQNKSRNYFLAQVRAAQRERAPLCPLSWCCAAKHASVKVAWIVLNWFWKLNCDWLTMAEMAVHNPLRDPDISRRSQRSNQTTPCFWITTRIHNTILAFNCQLFPIELKWEFWRLGFLRCGWIEQFLRSHPFASEIKLCEHVNMSPISR
jgi:hypothetical protein